MKKDKEKYQYYIILVLIAACICAPLLVGFPKGHDSIYHISKTVETEIALKEGQVVPLISSNSLRGFGYSWNLFYPYMSNYLMMGIKLIVHSYVASYNLLIFLSICVSGILFFKFIKEITNSNKTAFIGAIIYVLAPYRLIDIYIRGALGEVMAFVFMPMVFNGLYNIARKDGKEHYLLGIGAIGLILTHNISTLLVVLAVGLFFLIYINEFIKKDKIKYLLINLAFVILIVSFFYAPMLQNKSYTKYQVFETAEGTANNLKDHSVYLYQILFGKMQWRLVIYIRSSRWRK